MSASRGKKTAPIRSDRQSFKGAASIARRRAFKAGLPVVIMENDIIYYEYRDGTRKEAKESETVLKLKAT